MTILTATHYRDTEPIKCSCRKVHVPKFLTTEDHHVIPQAWQHFWRPGGMSLIAVAKLWDARTVELCRTCHGNVHYCLEYMMHQHQRVILAQRPDLRLAAKSAYTKNSGLPRAESDVAYLGMQRFTEAGGLLSDLTAHGLWGQI